jgi:5,10-methylenetetrahydromethanopterin reductase
MDFGIALATTVDSWKVVQQAEALGFTHAWFYDTQLLNPDVFIGMALAARETSRIRLGTGVLVPSNRLSAVTANCLATLNRLAPGRIDFGVGTGFTARRTMGLAGVKLADLTRYVDEVMALLRGETVDCLVEGEPRKLRFLNADVGMINIDDPVRLHVSALGPNARKATARLGAGWINFDGNNGRAIGALTDMQMSWANAGRVRDDLYASLFVLGCVLHPGERMTSPRVLAQAGPYAAVMLHNLIETSEAGDFEGYFPPEINDSLEGLRKVYQQYEPADARYLSLHRGHLMFLRPDERRFINKAMIEAFTYTAKPAQLAERVEALADAGYSQFTVQLVNGQEDALAEWAEVLEPLGLRAPG